MEEGQGAQSSLLWLQLLCERARMTGVCTPVNAPIYFGKEGRNIFQRVGVYGGNGDCNLGMDVHVSSYVPTAFEALGTFGYASLAKKALFST